MSVKSNNLPPLRSPPVCLRHAIRVRREEGGRSRSVSLAQPLVEKRSNPSHTGLGCFLYTQTKIQYS